MVLFKPPYNIDNQYKCSENGKKKNDYHLASNIRNDFPENNLTFGLVVRTVRYICARFYRKHIHENISEKRRREVVLPCVHTNTHILRRYESALISPDATLKVMYIYIDNQVVVYGMFAWDDIDFPVFKHFCFYDDQTHATRF